MRTRHLSAYNREYDGQNVLMTREERVSESECLVTAAIIGANLTESG